MKIESEIFELHTYRIHYKKATYQLSTVKTRV